MPLYTAMICLRTVWLILIFFSKSPASFISPELCPNAFKNNKSCDIDACKDRCGVISPAPCSCNQKCLVYNNCCEDFDTECPHLIQTMPPYYRGLMQSYVQCVDNVLVIASCPNGADGSRFVRGVTKGAHMMDFNDVISPNKTMTSNYVNKLITEVPVTDQSTNIYYINMSIYECHKGNTSNPVVWETKFYVLNDTMQKDIDTTTFHVRYEIPHKMPGPKGFCIDSSIGTCSGNNVSPESLLKCPTFLSLVINGTQIYNNKYCAECNKVMRWDLFDLELYRAYTRVTFNFSLLLKLEKDKIIILQDGLKKSAVFDWLSLECPVDEKSLRADCGILSCQEIYVKGQDGLCKEVHAIQFATPSRLFPSLKIFRSQVEQFIRCHLAQFQNIFLTQTLNATIKGEFYPNRTIFYVLEILLYSIENQPDEHEGKNMNAFIAVLQGHVSRHLIFSYINTTSSRNTLFTNLLTGERYSSVANYIGNGSTDTEEPMLKCKFAVSLAARKSNFQLSLLKYLTITVLLQT